MKLYCIRAKGGDFSSAFIKGHFAAIGWINDRDLSDVKSRDHIKELYVNSHRGEILSKDKINNQAGQIFTFLFRIETGDMIITPTNNAKSYNYGIVTDQLYYFQEDNSDCEYRQRIGVDWKGCIPRKKLYIENQKSLNSQMSVFVLKNADLFMDSISKHSEKLIYNNR